MIEQTPPLEFEFPSPQGRGEKIKAPIQKL
jgi:hypothetical protein